MHFSGSNATKDSPLPSDTDFIITTTKPTRSKNQAGSGNTGENSNAASYLGLFGGTPSSGPSLRSGGDLSGAIGDDVSALSDSHIVDEHLFCEATSIKVRATNAAIQPKTKGCSRNTAGNSSAFFRSSGSSGFFRANSLNNNPSQLSFPSGRIYGRAQEMAVLENALAKTATIDRQLILLEGTAGAGKSSLAHQLRHTVQTQGGFFLGGKYDQSTSQSTTVTPDSSGVSGYSSGGLIDEPYAAVTMACRDLCDALLAHKEDEILKQQQQNESHTEIGNHSSANLSGNSQGISNSSSLVSFPFTFEEFQTKLHAELEPAVLQVLTTVFPDLTQILGGNFLSDDLSSKGSDIGYNEAQQQFKYAIRRLLRVLCSFGRVVLFLDDCQWADAASLDLLKNLITDCRVNPLIKEEKKEPPTVLVESKNADATPGSDAKETDEKVKEPGLVDSDTAEVENGLLVLVAYRSDEVYERHPLLRAIEEIKTETTKDESVSLSVELSEVTVKHLGMEQVNELLFDILAADSLQETLSLAECIHRKTDGNILYVIQFLKTLSSEFQEKPLLKYNSRKSKWEWDVDEIRLQESATQNVVQMIQQKLENLQEGVRLLLPVVGLLGASFDYPVFERVLGHFNKIFMLDSVPSTGDEAAQEISRALLPEEFLAVCDEEGVLIFDSTTQQIRWDHDKIQEAAIDLVSAHELSKLRIRLGRLLMESFGKDDQDKNVFILINLLDGINYEIPSSDSNRLFLAELNWKAGSKAFRANAYTSAAVYLDRGIMLLPEGHWCDHYNLSLDLFSTAAEAHFCTGELAKANNRCEEVRAQMGSPKLDLQRANIVTLDVMNAKGQSLLAQDECIRMLSELGCTFPKRGQGLRTIGGLLKMGMTVKSLEEKIAILPVMNDPTKEWVMRLLDRLVTFAYHNKSDMFGLIVMKSFHYTLKYGSCDFTPPCIDTVGMMLGGILGDYDAMNRFGELAMDQYGSSQITRSTYPRAAMLSYGFNVCLHKPTWEYRIDLLECYKVGMASGDVESALWAIMIYLESGLILGLSLKLLEKDLHAYVLQMSDLKQEKVGIPCMGLWQAVSNLLGHSDKWSDLEKVFSKRLETVFGACQQSEHTQAFGHHYRESNAFYCGDYEKVLSIMKNYDCDKIFFCGFQLPTIHFQRSIAAFVVFRRTKNKKYKKLALQESKITKGLSKWGNPCLRHYVSFVDAENEALQTKNFEEAVKLYKKTIHLAGDKKIVHDQALANERLGDLYLSHNEESKARRHFEEASKLYMKWGSAERSNVVLSFGDRQKLQGSVFSEDSENTPTQRVSDGVFVVSEEH